MVQNMPTQFSRRIRADRVAADLTQAQLAKKAGLHFSTVSKFENGKLTGTRADSHDTVVRIAQALGQTPRDYLILAGQIVPEQEPTFQEQVMQRTDLTNSQKRALVELYETFLRGS